MVLRSTPVRAEQKSTGLLAPFSLYKYVAVWVPKTQAPLTDALITMLRKTFSMKHWNSEKIDAVP